MPVDPSLAKSLFLAASALTSPRERAAYLDRECGPDSELRTRVEALLAAIDAGGHLSESGSAATLEDPLVSEPGLTGAYLPQPPTVKESGAPSDVTSTFTNTERSTQVPGFTAGEVIAGRYVLVELIGEGGMGSVYLANQTAPVKRQVALKVIKTGMDSRAVVARFNSERQALAMMDHPNIARVFDGGTTPSGQPFFAMELVKGIPLTGYCDKYRLSVKARLELFVLVCQAVQHAHQKGIIHRDLKPANVLITEVDGRPTPKVIDFGVAKATEQNLTDTSLGELGAVVGTPAYMSPEQANPISMDIDTRTDVYALGVMLYELLVGSPPIDAKQFKKVAILEMLRMVREVEPPRPSTKLSTAQDLPNIAANRSIEPASLAKTLRGELDWVVMKALEKDRTRRYESATGLARDLQRYLADEVVEARPPSRGYRLRKFVRRHKGQVIAATLVILALVGGMIGTTLGMFEAERQKKHAEEGWARADAEQLLAEQNFATARELIMNMGTQINQMETGQKNPKLADQARRQALDAARGQFDQFRAGFADDLTLQQQAAALHRFAANVSKTLSEYPAASAAYNKSIQITEDLTKRFQDEPEYRITLALTIGDRGSLERRMGRLKEAAATLVQAAELAESLPGLNFERYYRKTMAKYKIEDSEIAKTRRLFENFAFNKTLGWILVDRAKVAYYRGLFEDSAKSASRASALLDQLKNAPPELGHAIDPVLAVIALNQLAIARRELGQTTEALAAHDDAVARTKSMTGPAASRDEQYWGSEVRRERARTAAVVPERRAVEANNLVEVSRVFEKMIDDYPQTAFYRESLAATYLLRGELLMLLGQLESAAAELQKSLTVSRELLDRFGVLSDSMLVRGRTFLAIGRVRAAAGKNDEAVANWKNAAKVFELALKIDPDNVHHRRGFAEAEQALKQPAK